METITFKMDSSLKKEMSEAMNPLYSTKTEFIREAIREKITREKAKALINKNFRSLDKERMTKEERKEYIEKLFELKELA